MLLVLHYSIYITVPVLYTFTRNKIERKRKSPYFWTTKTSSSHFTLGLKLIIKRQRQKRAIYQDASYISDPLTDTTVHTQTTRVQSTNTLYGTTQSHCSAQWQICTRGGEGAQTWNFMNHISLSFVRMQMPTHKLTVQVLDNTYRQYIRQYSTRGKFRPVYLCLSNLRLLLKSSVLSAINLQYCMQDFFCPIPYRHRTRNSDSCFATAPYCTLLTVFLH